ncbi:unnamed protein product [Dracunculus medinensis]|uniref:Pre-mRNA-splicing factor SLU7 n=1 Tax=Dracunculus medinensis TaxID=318479 RepID=A0A0N4U6G8_DRAME|nr:unnamed protein product [Dracunculus medinensis]
MANLLQTPVSQLIKRGVGIGEVQEGRKTKDEYRKQKDLEEERKLGIAPAMVDVVTGRDINPHIPEFIAKNPWYVPSEGPTLQHQRPHEERQIKLSAIDEWYKRGATNKVASKYRKGACENCGAMTHSKKDCFERPRKLGARWTEDDIAPDEYIQPKLTLAWDAKRDRWNGYDPESHRQVVEEYEKLEQARKMLREERMKEGLVNEGAKETNASDQPADEDMYADDADMAGVTVDMDSRTRITVRNLRIREDTAKYLYNLDPNGPYYDPKSRSMRENPFANIPGKEKEAAKFSGENFIRYTGEVVQANEAQVFAWQARCKGIDVHALAEPTKLEALKKEFEGQKSQAEEEHKRKLLEKYGGEEYLKAPAKELLLAQSEHYVEYSRTGKVVKGEERPTIRSRYEEDKYINNHTSVWGSYWEANRWGYSCCHSFFKNSYCTGPSVSDIKKESSISPFPNHSSPPLTGPQNASKGVKEEIKNAASSSSSSSDSESESNSDSDSEQLDSEEERQREHEREKELERRMREEKRKESRRLKRKRQKERKGKEEKKTRSNRSNMKGHNVKSSVSSDEEASSDLKQAIKRAEKQWLKADEELKQGDRKRRYHSTYEVSAPSEADIEAYKLTTIHSADPMAAYMLEKRRKK